MKEIKENNTDYINDIHRDIFDDSDIKVDGIIENTVDEDINNGVETETEDAAAEEYKDSNKEPEDSLPETENHESEKITEDAEKDIRDIPDDTIKISNPEEDTQTDSKIIFSEKDISENTADIPENKDNNKKSIEKEEETYIDDIKNSDISEIKIEIPEGIIDKLPDDFNIGDIGNIDLKEAEAVANEDILFLTEDDLILGLEEFDLIPLKDDSAGQTGQTPDDIKKSAPAEKITGEPEENETKTDTNQSKKEEITAEKESETEPEHDTPDIKQETEVENNIEPSEAKEDAEEKPEITETVINTGESQKDETEQDLIPETETLPENLREIAKDKENVLFLDDESLDKQKSETKLFEEDELEKITADIIDTIEGKPKILTEDKIDITGEDTDLANILTHSEDKFKDLWLDFEDSEYKYRDSELDFIENAIIGDDYGEYIKEIDDLYAEKEEDAGEKISKAIELFGLSLNEIDNIEERLFHDEYSEIDLEKEYELIKSDFGKIDLSKVKEKSINYIVPDEKSLSEKDRNSIEEDLSSTSALIFEEDINEIKRLYGKETDDDIEYQSGSPDEKHFEEEVEAADRIFKENRFEIIEETDNKEEDSAAKPSHPMPQDNNFEIIEEETFIAEEQSEKEAQTDEEIPDITDNIVILEDNSDVDRFIKEFPEDKQMNLKKLLTYLDGLFEKLPENTIKSFANSEYFDLYVKILNDMGIS